MKLTQSQADISNFAHSLVDPLVQYPSYVEITARIPETVAERTLVDIKGHAKCDHGKLVGGKGQTFRAYQFLLSTYARTHAFPPVYVTLHEGVRVATETDIPDDPDWDAVKRGAIERMVIGILYDATGVEATVSGRENHDSTIIDVRSKAMTSEIGTALSVLIKAIGRMRGRKILFNAEEATPSARTPGKVV